MVKMRAGTVLPEGWEIGWFWCSPDISLVGYYVRSKETGTYPTGPWVQVVVSDAEDALEGEDLEVALDRAEMAEEFEPSVDEEIWLTW